MKVKVHVTLRDLAKRGIWGEICEIKGWCPWSINTELTGSATILLLTENQVRGLGLVDKVVK